ncbi:PREDICTED: serine/threonine-phosphatase 7 long [Prunus dulcis]|uniref:PREDICTED: serine/threonine-phosphatase 7 long n=1 Tax=Prunus dulcis TaxID=3755 RepID=A0A5E4GL39_PRUDU|nr:PREDICTED: serine/threonine-phosphatase 7 long [Prunus dulcis]
MEMDTVGILVFYNGSWVHKDNIESYEGGEAKGIIVSQNVTFSELVDLIYKIMNADRNKYIVTLKYSVPLSSSAYKRLKVEDNDDVQYFLKYNTEL